MIFDLFSVIFGVLLWTLFLAGASAMAFVLIEGFCLIVRVFKPEFFLEQRQKIERDTHVAERQERKLVAIDFLMQERIRKQREARKTLQTQLFGESAPIVSQAMLPDEVSFEDITKIVANIEARQMKVPPVENHAAQYALAQLSDTGKKRYLCHKVVRRDEATGEIKRTVIFAALMRDAMRLDLTSAQRLLGVLPEGVFIDPVNAAGRIEQRRLWIETGALNAIHGEQVSSAAVSQ